MAMRRVFLAQDHDSHWYVVDALRRFEWLEWLDIPDDDERAWTVPDYAIMVHGHISTLTFFVEEE